MSDCCLSPPGVAAPRKHTCPVNGIECAEVPVRTILHHLKRPWAWKEERQRYFFCDAADCDVVYFGEDGSTIPKAEVRSTVGIKETSLDSPLCYCFGISQLDAAADPALREFVMQKTQLGLCSCATSNPSGRCCLKDFPRGEQR